ncbi:heparinase II/III family protein [Campylobacter peloridis]|uniref:Heparinase II/III family protein n=1 Tax=Campylobacter peloridis TaxID=488546 RepID=A0ABX6TQT1_9BACT|nr:heparinase II/III family protein [Campylobacter peloridis]AJC84184.1 heparinase II/III family protein [Campylobacter peloridis LMG 23910]QOQ88285.1 heparinase II/III family protein [Campylobacter peloridis]
MNKDDLQYLIKNKILRLANYEDINFNTIDWTYNPYNHTNYIFILHKMEYLLDLAYFYIDTKDKNIKDIIFDILNSWYLSCNDKLDNPWIFHDHATALRASNISKILSIIKSCISKDEFLLFQKILTIDVNKLLLDEFYSKNTNHGLDQSLSLYEASFFLEVNNVLDIRNIATNRINDELRFAFCDDGGHKENSPAYLSYGISQVLRALDIGYKYEKENTKIYFPLDLLKKSCLVLGYFVQFNGNLPLIGDTTIFKINNLLLNKLSMHNCKEYENYIYLISNGKEGVKPDKDLLFLNDSGYAIIKDFDNKLNLVFKCKHISNYHRHDDDLSFTLFYDNEEWFVDSGLYEYAEKDEFRRYLRSHFSHNLTYPNNFKAHRNLSRSLKTHINNLSNENIYRFEGYSYMFDGFENYRSIEYDKNNLIFTIIDKCKILNKKLESIVIKNDVSYITNFIIPKNKKIIIDELNKCVKIIGQNKILHLVYQDNISNVYIEENYISRRINTKESVNVLKFCHNGICLDNVFYLTYSSDFINYKN